MKVTITEPREIDVKYFCASVQPRYFEDGEINGEDDIPYEEQEKGAKPRMPLVVENPNAKYADEKYNWDIKIDLETGNILNWPQGTKAYVHYKVCDQGIYWLEDAEGNEIHKIESYVPSILDTEGDSYGDYVLLTIDENGHIEDWHKESEIKDLINKFMEDEGF